MSNTPAQQNSNAPLFVNRNGRVWTNYNLDLSASNYYSIDNTPVLSSSALGVTVLTSNLRQVGTLNYLDVAGDVQLGQFAFFNSSYNRLGLGVEEPSASIDILDNNVQITIGSPQINLAQIGTASNHDLALATDGLARITVRANGEIDIGDPNSKTAVVNINGVLNVTSIVTDSRIDRTSPLQFQATSNSSIYGLGLNWTGTGSIRQFIMHSGPDRIWSSESIDIAENKSFYINNIPVLSAQSLGPTIVNSSLSSVGILKDLTVNGSGNFHSDVSIAGNLATGQLLLEEGSNTLTYTGTGIKTNSFISINGSTDTLFYGDNASIEIGSVTNTRKPVKMFGPLSININNPDPTLSFSVAGDVNIGNKRFTNGTAIPQIGTYDVGDICWNTAPIQDSYIGWVCVVAGSPGQWLGFGQIASQ
jgi:hypothetical protein